MKRLSQALKDTYGEKVYRLSLSSGCTCPNRDGTLGTGGCTFCSEGGSGEFAAELVPLKEQLEQAKEQIRAKTNAEKFIAYFQSFTNTYGDPKRLRKLYTEAILREEVAVLSLGTRPDCLPEEMLQMLRDLNEIKPVWVELGLQTIHERTAKRIHRGYPPQVFEESFRKLKESGLTVIVHVIFGLPGETKEAWPGMEKGLSRRGSFQCRSQTRWEPGTALSQGLQLRGWKADRSPSVCSPGQKAVL